MEKLVNIKHLLEDFDFNAYLNNDEDDAISLIYFKDIVNDLILNPEKVKKILSNQQNLGEQYIQSLDDPLTEAVQKINKDITLVDILNKLMWVFTNKCCNLQKGNIPYEDIEQYFIIQDKEEVYENGEVYSPGISVKFSLYEKCVDTYKENPDDNLLITIIWCIYVLLFLQEDDEMLFFSGEFELDYDDMGDGLEAYVSDIKITGIADYSSVHMFDNTDFYTPTRFDINRGDINKLSKDWGTFMAELCDFDSVEWYNIFAKAARDEEENRDYGRYYYDDY